MLAVHATPPPLAPAIQQNRDVYRAITGGELPYISNYVVGRPPPEPLGIAGDFGRNGGLYAFTDFNDAVEWGRHKSGYYTGLDNRRVRNWAQCQYYVVQMTIECNPSQFATREFSADTQNFRDFVINNYPPYDHPGHNSMIWGEMFTPAYDIVTGPLTAARAQAAVKVTPAGSFYSQQIAFVTERARNCLRVKAVLYGPTMECQWNVQCFLHLGQLTKYRLWWLLPTVCLCGAMEIAGWAARLWSSYSPLLSSPFQMQITLTIIGPTPLLAANFIILGEIIKYLGPAYSRISPRMYSIIFCTCFDERTGCGLVIYPRSWRGSGATADTSEGAENGAHIMLVGIAFQLFVIVAYSLTSSGWKIWEKKSFQLLSSGRRAPLTRNLKIMTGALIFNTTALFIRAIYRTIELVDGWNGPIITNELYFNVLDGAMIILAIYTLNFIHPGMFLEKVPEAESREHEMKLNQLNSV
ncbi:hypothetical protein CVT24_008862 [Panaeolus cyanescens]|uniref:Uncharacterized protein n=1 Tax=Panaeolus cyanescens TaxID=181874 RepID=A0A409VCS4_9AGAR|nr:hypothetical protein CVT24_008862 [Panaeolus cyanescens]